MKCTKANKNALTFISYWTICRKTTMYPGFVNYNVLVPLQNDFKQIWLKRSKNI